MNPNPFQPPEQTEGTLVEEVRHIADSMLPIAFYIGGITVAVGTVLILPMAKSLYLFFMLFPFVFGPLLIAMIPMWFCRSIKSQKILILAAIAYAVWFFYTYWFVSNARDGGAIIVLFLVGFFATPFLLVLCTISLLFHRQKRRV